MTPTETYSVNNRRFVCELLSRLLAPLPTCKPDDWVETHVVFNDKDVRGKFSFRGRNYLRDIINDAADHDCHDQIVIAGTGSGKTVAMFAQHGYLMEFEPRRTLWAMPAKEGEGGAVDLCNNRFIPMIRAMDVFRDKLPSNRHKITGEHVEFGGNYIGFVGANSTGALGSNRCGFTRADEIDKFPHTIKQEAGALYLLDERTKGVPFSKRFKSTTPTIEDGPGWQLLMRSDLRRRFLPCPHCNPKADTTELKGWFVLVWNRQYTVLPTRVESGVDIPLAEVRWSESAKRKDGSIDKQVVIETAHFVCPHCKCEIRDHHRNWMDEHGRWIATKSGDPFHRGYHLSSLYAPFIDFDSSLGGMALKFLKSLESGQGMRGFINSDLAEVDKAQENPQVEIQIAETRSNNSGFIPLMTVDVQKNWPYLWFIVRNWSTAKFHPRFELVNGVPKIIDQIRGIPKLDSQCQTLLAGHQAAWEVICEVLRLDPQLGPGEFPALEWLISQNIIGKTLISFYESHEKDVIQMAKTIYKAIGQRMPTAGDSELVAAGHCDTDDWSELRDYFLQFKVGIGLYETIFQNVMHTPGSGMLIDAGYAEKNNPEVLRKCYETATHYGYIDPSTLGIFPGRMHALCKPCPIGNWTPYKGFPIKTRWTVGNIKREWTKKIFDPFTGMKEADQRAIRVTVAAADVFWERMTDVRERQDEKYLARGGNVWSVSAKAEFHGRLGQMKDYREHMSNRFRNQDGEIVDRGSGGAGKQRYPDHLNDCEKMQFVLATERGFFSAAIGGKK